MLVSVTGYQALVLFSLGWLISHQLDGDPRYLGYMATALAVPAIGLALVGGVFADKLDSKRLLGLTQITLALVVAGLALLTAFDVVNQWHVLAAAFLVGAIGAFDNPVRQTIFPRLIEPTALPSAVALNSAIWTGTRIYAPFMAGIIIGRTDTAVAIFVSAAGFLALALIAQTLKPRPTQPAGQGVLEEMASGFAYILHRPLFSTLISMTFFMAAFGASYVFLMPVFADEVLKVSAEKIGYLMGAAGVGALAGIALGANLVGSRHRGRVLLAGGFPFGAFLMLFALVSHLGLYKTSMAVLLLADMSFSIYLMVVITTLQSLVPDRLRGRVMGIFSVTWSLVPLGALVSSQITHYQSAPVAVAIGGGLVAACASGVGLMSRRVRELGGSAGEMLES